MWYKTGTVTYKAGSALMTGKDTLWADNKMGVGPGDLVLISITDDNVMMAEVNKVISDTQIELRTVFNKDSMTDTKYAIISTLNETIADFAKRISASILYFNEQADAYKTLDEDVKKQIATITADVLKKTSAIDSKANTKANKTGDTFTGRVAYQMAGESITIKNSVDAENASSYLRWRNADNSVLSFIGRPVGVGTDVAWSQEAYKTTLTLKTDRVHSNKDLWVNNSRVYHQGFKPTAAELNTYTKPESDGKYFAKGANVQFSGSGKTTNFGIGTSDSFWMNNKSGKTLQLKDDGRLTYSDKNVFHDGHLPTKAQLAEGIVNGQLISTGDHGLRNMASRHIRFEYAKNDGTWATDGFIFKDGVDNKSRRPGIRINAAAPDKAKGNQGGSGDYVFGEDGILTIPKGVQVGTVGSAALMIGDNDSGFKGQKDGEVEFWANNGKRGYWNTGRLEHVSFASTSADGLRLMQGNRSVILRNDNSNYYFLVTNANDPYGMWNGLRPFSFNLNDGNVNMHHNLNVNGVLTVANQINTTHTYRLGNGGGNGSSVYSSVVRLWGDGGERRAVREWDWEGGPWSAYLEFSRSLNATKFSVNGQIVGNVVNTSDRRLKTEILPVYDALDKVNQLSGYTWRWLKDDTYSAGVVAQELLEVLPTAVGVTNNPDDPEDETDYYTVEYNQIHALTIEAIKELTSQNKTLTNTVELMKADLEKLREELYNMKVSGVSVEAPSVNDEETP